MSPSRRKRPTTGNRKSKAELAEIVAAIRKLQGDEQQAHVEAIQARIEIGKKLAELRTAVAHGKWSEILKQVGYNERTAQRYIEVGKSWWQIRTMGSDLLAKLPWDLQKLAVLSRLSPDQLQDFLAGADVDEMSRGEVLQAVNEVVKPERVPEPVASPAESSRSPAGQQSAPPAPRLRKRSHPSVPSYQRGIRETTGSSPPLVVISEDDDTEEHSEVQAFLEATEAICAVPVEGVIAAVNGCRERRMKERFEAALEETIAHLTRMSDAMATDCEE